MVTALTLTTTPDAVYLVLLTVAAVFLANTTQHRDGGGGGRGKGGELVRVEESVFRS